FMFMFFFLFFFFCFWLLFCFFFFFQAEDGIRDATVTGVQTCALPIYAAGQPVEEVSRQGLVAGRDRRVQPVGLSRPVTHPDVGSRSRARGPPRREGGDVA